MPNPNSFSHQQEFEDEAQSGLYIYVSLFTALKKTLSKYLTIPSIGSDTVSHLFQRVFELNPVLNFVWFFNIKTLHY